MPAKPARLQLLTWFLLNIFLVFLIIFILDFFNIWSFTNFYNETFGEKSEKVVMKKEEPLLLERENLEKAKKSLKDREQLLKTRELALAETQKHFDEMLLQLKKKADQLNEKENAMKTAEVAKNDRNKNIQKLAERFSNMPPAEAVKIIVGLDSLLIIDIFREMDKRSAEAGQQSSVPYYLSLIASDDKAQGGQVNPKKAQEISRLLAKNPAEEKFDTDEEAAATPALLEETEEEDLAPAPEVE